MWEPKTFGFMVSESKLSASGKAIVDRNAAAMAGGRIMQTAWTSCRAGAVSTMTMPRMVRRIRIGGEHPQSLTASYVGDSIGRWEGDTLVVDSVGFNGYAELDARGQPTSPQLHTVERFAPAADGGIDIAVTITDPEYYSESVNIKRSWKKCASSTCRCAIASRARDWNFRKWSAKNKPRRRECVQPFVV
jgi:hypothetical protein